MEKQQPNFLKRWQKRYFILENKMLKYYKNEAEYKANSMPKGVLNFHQIWIEPSFNDKKLKIDLHIKGTTRIFNLRVSKSEEFNIWKKRISHSINTSAGKLNQCSLDENDQRYWRNLRISESGVINEAQTGDIIISKSKKSKKQIDRVALVVKLTQQNNDN